MLSQRTGCVCTLLAFCLFEAVDALKVGCTAGLKRKARNGTATHRTWPFAGK